MAKPSVPLVRTAVRRDKGCYRGGGLTGIWGTANRCKAAVISGAGTTVATNGNDTHNLTFTGSNTGSNTFAPMIVDGVQPTNVAKTGVGKWELTHANTYTGGTTVSGGSLSGDLTLALTGLADTWYGAHSELYLYQDSMTGADDIEVDVVPEPGTWALMLGGLAMLVFWQRSRRKS